MKKRRLASILAIAMAASLVMGGTAFATEKEEEKTEEKEEKAEEKEEKDEEKAEEAEEEGKENKAEREEHNPEKEEDKAEEDEEKLEDEEGEGGMMEMEAPVINNGELTVVENGDWAALFGLIGSWTGGGVNDDGAGTPDLSLDNDYVYTAAIVDIDGDLETYSNDGLLEAGDVTDSSADNVVINDSTAGHNGIILVNAGNYEITNAQITMQTDADGNTTCDFSGQGSGILVSGDTYATISDSTIDMAGVATMPVFVDDGATALIKNSTMVSAGGTLYGDYMNSPDQASMVAPPWILGIMGTSRCTNLMGNDSTMHVVDSDTSSGAWAVLSTDSGSNMYLNIYNTSLTLNNADESAAAPLQEATASIGVDSEIYETVDNPYTTNYGSGYGTYVIGDAVETFAGATVNVGTYASIFTGGSATYTSIKAGETYTLPSATGETDYEYTATEDKNTVINSDTFGFMIHQSGDTIIIDEGTEINSGLDTFLVKSGSSNEEVIASVDGATINNGGVLIQIMDNDDATTGGMMDVDDVRNLNGNFMNFMPVHEENEGFNTNEAEADGSSQMFSFSNGSYSGNIYNASGSDNSDYGPLGGTDLMVGFDAADYSGAIAQTAAIHVTYDGAMAVKDQGGYAYTNDNMDEILQYQNTSFDMTHYFDIGHVANLICDNGANTITVTMQDSATWTVTGDSVITALYAIDDSSIIVNDGVTLTVGGQEYGPGTYTGDDFDDGAELSED